jgi:hypothetical protein
MKYTRDLPEDATQDQIDGTLKHVRDHLASIADTDDDPATRSEDVEVRVERVDGKIRITGYLDAEPDAPYLKPGYDPYDGVDEALLAQVRDDEVTE